MIIRKAQMEKLSEGAQRDFEVEMVAHLAEFSPPLFKVIKEEQMREVVRFGINQAREYRFTLRGPTRLYLELMLLFGSHFDTDPQYPWAGEILKDRYSVSEMQRAEWLYEKTLEYQEKVSGPNAVNARKAMEDLLIFAKNPLPFSSKEFRLGVLSEMKRVFPLKANFVGEEALKTLINKGGKEARKHKFPTVRGATLIVVLMYAFGHGCAEDLLYPWIGRTLNDEKIIEPLARSERLEKKAITWLEHVLGKSNEGAQM